MACGGGEGLWASGRGSGNFQTRLPSSNCTTAAEAARCGEGSIAGSVSNSASEAGVLHLGLRTISVPAPVQGPANHRRPGPLPTLPLSLLSIPTPHILLRHPISQGS